MDRRWMGLQAVREPITRQRGRWVANRPLPAARGERSGHKRWEFAPLDTPAPYPPPPAGPPEATGGNMPRPQGPQGKTGGGVGHPGKGPPASGGAGFWQRPLQGNRPRLGGDRRRPLGGATGGPERSGGPTRNDQRPRSGGRWQMGGRSCRAVTLRTLRPRREAAGAHPSRSLPRDGPQ